MKKNGKKVTYLDFFFILDSAMSDDAEIQKCRKSKQSPNLPCSDTKIDAGQRSNDVLKN